MYLARDIYHFNGLLLKAGTGNLNRYLNSLSNLGIAFLYINDDLSEGIDIPDAVAEETRVKCKDALQDTLFHFRTEGSLDTAHITEAVDSLIDDLFTRKDILVSLSDIATTDDNTLVHSINTTIYALLIGKRLELNPTEMHVLAEGAILHDIGKTLLDPKILFKTTPLTKEEFAHIQNHPLQGYQALQQNPLLSELSRLLALQHHERLDGSGYPYHLKGNEIHRFSKILAIADIYDALTSERCYRKGMSNYQAYETLMAECGDKIDAELLHIFFNSIAIYPNGSIVNLSNGLRGIVKAQNEKAPFRPIIRVIDDVHYEEVKLYDLDLLQNLSVIIMR
ncbi:MAG: HD-GYP domain-containing protein [Lachnospiraceae bacterium]|nr:HD-GYP domain-containing protein [Lachnospiraceae bacterium]